MPSYRPPISRDQLVQLEHYLFCLLRYTLTVEFKELTGDNHAKIHREIAYMEMAINIMQNLLTGGNDVPVVGWEVEGVPTEYVRVYHFSSAKLASLCAHANPSHVISVCKGTRKYTAGWKFMYKKDYDEQNVTVKTYGKNES